MLSNKSYLIRAFYEWIVDSECTPFLVINANVPRCNIPNDPTLIENGEITLNISPSAIRDLKITNDLVSFRASFSGVVHIISAPLKAVLAIYAQENQQGMFFDYEDMGEELPADLAIVPSVVDQSDFSITTKTTSTKKPYLKLLDSADIPSQ